MAIFNNMSITTKGQVLYAKAQAGIQLNFTKIMVGSGQIENRNPATLLALLEPKFSIGIQSITPNTELKTATISATMVNNEVTEAVYICEIGLFAEDPDEGEILYAYGSAGTYGDYYAPASQGAYSWNYQINAAIGNASNVTVELSSLSYDYAVINSNSTFVVLSGGNQKEINKSIDTKLSELTAQSNDMAYVDAGGTATAITVQMQDLYNGYHKTFIAKSNNNGAATTVNGKNLYKPNTTTAPNIISGKAYTVWYNSVADCFFLQASAEGDVVASEVLAGKKFSNDNDTGIPGTMPNIGQQISTINAGGKTMISKGYHDGTGYVQSNSLATQMANNGVTLTSASQIINGIKAMDKNGNVIPGTATIESLGGAKIISKTINASVSYVLNSYSYIWSQSITLNLNTLIGFTPRYIIITYISKESSTLSDTFMRIYDLVNNLTMTSVQTCNWGSTSSSDNGTSWNSCKSISSNFNLSSVLVHSCDNLTNRYRLCKLYNYEDVYDTGKDTGAKTVPLTIVAIK